MELVAIHKMPDPDDHRRPLAQYTPGSSSGLTRWPDTSQAAWCTTDETPTVAEIHAPTTTTPLVAGVWGQPPLTPPLPLVNPTIADPPANAQQTHHIVNEAATSARDDELDAAPRTLNLREEATLGNPEAWQRFAESGLASPRQPNAATPRAAADQRAVTPTWRPFRVIAGPRIVRRNADGPRAQLAR